MERPFTSELDPRINSLEKRRNAAAFFAENIGTPGWIESQWAEGIRKGGQRLALVGLTDEDRFARLASTTIPLQLRLIGEVLPNFEEKIAKLRQQKEVERIKAIRDRFNLEPLYKPQRNYSEVISAPEMIRFMNQSRNPAALPLIQDFLRSKGASRVFNAIVNFSGSQTTRSDEFSKYFDSAIFEEIGYLYTSSRNRSGDITVLSPEETSILFRNIHPQRDFQTSGYGMYFNVPGLSLPDGLVIKNADGNLEVVLAVDYKLISRNNYDISAMKAQAEYFTPEQLAVHLRLKNHQPLDPLYVGRLIHLIRPSIPEKPVRVNPDLKTLYVIPKGTDIRMRGILIEEVPITSGGIHALGQELKKVKLLQKED